MTTTGLDVFDRTVQTANEWLKEIERTTGWEDRHKAYKALRATLQVLRDRLPPGEAAHFGSQLPLLIAGIYFNGWSPTKKMEKFRHPDEFFNRIKGQFQDESVDPRSVVEAVFQLLGKKISEGELEDISNVLPPELESFWEESIRH